MPHSVQITAKALGEIDEALAWKANRSIKAAIRWYVKLMEAIRSLADNPERFGLAPESESCSAEIHQILCGKRRRIYRVLFEIRGDTVYILRVRHSAQNLLTPEDCESRTFCFLYLWSIRSKPMKCYCSLLAAMLVTALLASVDAGDPAATTPVQADMVKHLDSIRDELVTVNQDIWTYAELGLQEHKSSARLVDVLKKAGFKVEVGVAGMPTAFIAEYGSGSPVVGILAEYDALPELAQQIAGDRKPITGSGNGHGCGHCALGTGSIGAALAVKAVYDKHKLKGTIRVYGTPAEETLIGKVYMLLAGLFRDLDVCLHWHPGTQNRVYYSTSKAMVSAKFTYHGIAAHASGSPDKGKSALDGVELMNVGANYMREHIKDSSRVHYVITNGGGQPNVVPATAQVWYYVRANDHGDAEKHFDWLKDIADGAAKMSRTKVETKIDTDCHEIIPNLALSKVVLKNFKKVGAPQFAKADHDLARQLQTAIRADFGLKETKTLNETVEELPVKPYQDAGSTDVGDISWHVPTSGLTTACFAAGSPGHSWQNVAAVGSPIGHKGMMIAAKVLALSTVDLLQNPELVREAKADFQERMKDRKYTTIIPKGQKAPKAIR